MVLAWWQQEFGGRAAQVEKQPAVTALGWAKETLGVVEEGGGW